MTSPFFRRGFEISRGFLSVAECENYLRSVRELERLEGLPLIERQASGRALRYKVIDGRRIGSAIPDIDKLTECVRAELEQVTGSSLKPIRDAVAARNVNVTPPGGQYRWHYDRNAVTAIMYLNEVPGGETEMYPNYRLVLPGVQRLPRLQRWLDGLLRLSAARWLSGRRVVVAPERGSMLIIRGDRTLHSVRRVDGDQDRVSMILAFDGPGAGTTRGGLDAYLYDQSAALNGDPNYGT